MASVPSSGGEGSSFSGGTVVEKLQEWGSNSLPPALMATLITALHARPMKPFALAFFVPPLLFSSYVNLLGFPTASAGITAAWSGVYALLAFRRRQSLRNKFSVRGLVRGSAIGMGSANALAGGWVYSRGDLKKDNEERLKRNRWGAVEE
ncbi:hypothetical protein E4U57_000532 [Claviceps arundinis]|uniref:Altered inheritance of mitochondria protein 19 n=1 Tax=Claviceps arundinis TaxID=1623583 RepID=A0A9P7MQ76_9HYPO|nr:hypothetical protein E4U57_000532 [Claviceps arundinis]KAG5963505.1 hypothetical protein E4U56_002729 [Claviceps arundinis]